MRAPASSSPTSASTSTTASRSSCTCWSSSTPARPRRRPRCSRAPRAASSPSPRSPRSRARRPPPAATRPTERPSSASEELPQARGGLLPQPADDLERLLVGKADEDGRETEPIDHARELVGPARRVTLERHHVGGALDLGRVAPRDLRALVDGPLHGGHLFP